MQYITQCPHYSRLITRRFRENNYLLFQIVKEQPIDPSSMRRSTNQSRGLIADSSWNAGGANRDRTGDLLLAKQALSQLSYGPFGARILTRGSDGLCGGSGWI